MMVPRSRVTFSACSVFLPSLLLVTSSCALLTKADPIVPRYFTPEPAETTSTPSPRAASGLSIRLGRIAAGSYLKERNRSRREGQAAG